MTGDRSDDPALLDLDSTRAAHRRLRSTLEEISVLSPEAAALRTLVLQVSDALDSRDVRALDSNLAERELQFLADLRASTDRALSNAVPYAQKKRGLSWQRIGDLLGMSRQAAWERFRV